MCCTLLIHTGDLQHHLKTHLFIRQKGRLSYSCRNRNSNNLNAALVTSKIFMHINFVTLFFVAAILLLNSGYHILFENQTVKNFFYENSMSNITAWIQPSPPVVFNILELEWTKFHKSKHYGNELFKSKRSFFS